MITMDLFHTIRHLKYQQKKSDRAIAKELGVDRKTVGKYLKSGEAPGYRPRSKSTREDPLSAYHDRLNILAKDPTNLAVDIYECLVSEGYQGSERTIRRRMADIRSLKEKERFFEQEYRPGEQAQFDFKESFSVPFQGGDKTLQLHFGTLPYSGFFFISAYYRPNYESFIEGIHRFFESSGGQTHEIRIDNLSPCVSRVEGGKRRTYTSSFQAAIDYYNFKVSPCSPGKGNEKGDVEREIRTHARRIKKRFEREGVCFGDIEELNQWLTQYCQQKWTEKCLEKLEEERSELTPLLKRDLDIMCRTEKRRVGPTGLVRIGDYVYSVPSHAIGKWCLVYRGPHQMIIKDVQTGNVIAAHSRELGDSLKLEHILPSLVLKPGAMIRWAHKDVLFPEVVFKTFYRSLQKIDQEGAEREYLRVLNLIQHTSLGEIQEAIEIALEDMPEDPYHTIRDLLLGGGNASNIKFLEDHKQDPFQPNLGQYDELIDPT